MTTPSGTTPFVDVKNATYNSISLFAVNRIEHSRRTQRVFSKDNNHLRYVASHAVFVEDTVTIESADLYGLQQMALQTGMHDLVFTAVVSAQNTGTNTLTNQTVTIKNVVWDGQKNDWKMKAEGTYSLSGTILGVTDDSDPVVYATAT